jgi:hypothetical protein
MNQDLPPKKPININIVSQSHFRPMLVYVTHDIWLRMQGVLHEEDMTWDNFIQSACVNFLNQRIKDREELHKYIAFSEMQLFEESTDVEEQIDVYANESTSSSSLDILDIFKEGK